MLCTVDIYNADVLQYRKIQNSHSANIIPSKMVSLPLSFIVVLLGAAVQSVSAAPNITATDLGDTCPSSRSA